MEKKSEGNLPLEKLKINDGIFANDQNEGKKSKSKKGGLNFLEKISREGHEKSDRNLSSSDVTTTTTAAAATVTTTTTAAAAAAAGGKDSIENILSILQNQFKKTEKLAEKLTENDNFPKDVRRKKSVFSTLRNRTEEGHAKNSTVKKKTKNDKTILKTSMDRLLEDDDDVDVGATNTLEKKNKILSWNKKTGNLSFDYLREKKYPGDLGRDSNTEMSFIRLNDGKKSSLISVIIKKNFF